MNKLELVNDLRMEASVSGSGITTTVGQTGEPARLVKWIEQAYEEIQNIYFDWNFLRKDATVTTVSGQSKRTAEDDVGIYNLDDFYTAAGAEMDVRERIDLDHQLPSINNGTPYLIVVEPNKDLFFYPTPDAAYTYNYSYFRKPFTLDGDDAEPAFPEQFHKLIVARAMIYYGNYESAVEVKSQGTELWQVYLPRLTASQAPHKSQTYGRSQPRHIQVVAQ